MTDFFEAGRAAVVPAFSLILAALFIGFFASRFGQWLAGRFGLRSGVPRIVAGSALGFGTVAGIAILAHDAGDGPLSVRLIFLALSVGVWIAVDLYRHFRPVKPKAPEDAAIIAAVTSAPAGTAPHE